MRAPYTAGVAGGTAEICINSTGRSATELLKYWKAGWNVEFHRDYATMSVPAVLS